MADAWRTVVHREPEWDEQSRTEAIAAVLAESVTCPKCGNVDTVVEVQTSLPAGWVWPPRSHDEQTDSRIRDDEQVFEIKVYRCVACAGIAITERGLQHQAAAIDKPGPRQLLPTDATWGRANRHIPRAPRA